MQRQASGNLLILLVEKRHGPGEMERKRDASGCGARGQMEREEKRLCPT